MAGARERAKWVSGPFETNRIPDHQQASKLARELHTHAVQYNHKLVTTRHAIENKNAPYNQVLEQGASRTLQIPTDPFCYCFVVEEIYGFL
eukprot:1152023-Pelagomonas_calceolata.AAC.1